MSRLVNEKYWHNTNSRDALKKWHSLAGCVKPTRCECANRPNIFNFDNSQSKFLVMKKMKIRICCAVGVHFFVFILPASCFGQGNLALDSIKNNISIEHKLLARSKGKWTGEASVWFSVNKPPLSSTSVLKNYMDATGRFLISEIEGNITGAGRPFIGVRITGYDPVRKVFTRAMIQDGNPGVVMEGKWDEATKSISMLYKQFDNNGDENSLKEIYTFVDENTEILEVYKTDTTNGGNFRLLKVVWKRNN